ncbi:L-asparaginase/archaeal Glu-tRNAGln amidotransferase subunit D [Cupriavidus necator]|uniref:Asparaginase n=1 Tax=Cupriavidus necator (strain ATCC 17699 / DSM 428 / KCTC 22496 / NCIMB 10442 / H16 / Stanier 337) TaxID=381666 RepID=Q0KAG0_CUPNH|nr:asparaginase [Cupriavidus necator]QCC00849.1 asparaginase [Cupriavidus necator H16]QQB76321.1 asparaginase [Cupriavidus necator]WKA39216.1 asparaginase [Cupriavidus necator]CAJ93011.1 Glutaminase-asparaginase (amidohydrolase) [Cupriavidus necator H16]
MKHFARVTTLAAALLSASLITGTAHAQLAPAAQSAAAPATAQAEARKANIVIIGTGGTIAGAGASVTNTAAYQSAVVPVDKIIASVPEISKVANVKGEQIFQIGSESFNNERLLKLAKRVSELLKQPDVDGIVITHGTDTIEETAYFLNLTLKSDKPVVVVGSMRPGTALGADGALNLYDAVLVASNPASKGKGTLAVLNDEIHTGRDVTKSNTFKTETFRSPFGPLGYVVEGRTLFYRLPARPHTLQTQWDIDKIDKLPEVAVLYAYGNANPAAVDAAVKSGAKAIIYAATGNGSVGDYMVESLKAARAKGVQIVRASRTGSGVVVRNAEQPDDKYDWIVTDDQLPQKARILMALALTQTNDAKALQQVFWKY